MKKCVYSFGSLHLGSESRKLIREILASGRASSGKYVRAFEKAFAKLVGVKEAVAVSSGTDAVALALAVLYDFGACRGDEIIVPALTFIGSVNAVLQAGFTPVFVDIRLESLAIDHERIEERITSRTKAILAVHLMGKPAEMEAILKIAKKYNLWVVEDAAEAHGAVYHGRNVGAIGNLGAFSLYVAHIVSTIEGGIVTTNDQEIAGILRSLRCHGRACKCAVCTLNTRDGYCPLRFKEGRDIRFLFERVGFSAKMNELEAAVGLGNLTSFKKNLAKRRQNFARLTEKLKEFSDWFLFLQEEAKEKIGPHAFPLIVKKEANFTRDELVMYLARHGIDSRDLFSCIPTECRGYSFLGYQKGSFPVAEFVSSHGLHLGIHQDIGSRQIDYLKKQCTSF